MNNSTDVDADGRPQQMRLLKIGAIAGAVLFGMSLVVHLTGANEPELPKRPGLPGLPSGRPPGGFPTDLPRDLPTDFPTGLPSNFPTGIPLPPPNPGGAP
ncbi:hypothetical protein ACQEU3_39215 [Spirillospora sp. CA-253888]